MGRAIRADEADDVEASAKAVFRAGLLAKFKDVPLALQRGKIKSVTVLCRLTFDIEFSPSTALK